MGVWYTPEDSTDKKLSAIGPVYSSLVIESKNSKSNTPYPGFVLPEIYLHTKFPDPVRDITVFELAINVILILSNLPS